jgi:hypothetical protein
MMLFDLTPQDRLNYNGQIYSFYEDCISCEGIKNRVYKRYHDNKRATFDHDVEVELYGAPGQILFYKLKNI